MPETFESKHERTISNLIRKWERTWGLPGLSGKIKVIFSTRLRSSWGRSSPRLYRVKLHLALRRNTSKLPLVLCHETAHVAAYHLFGDQILPHGREWQRLVTQAGYTPQTKLRLPLSSGREISSSKRLYEHICPVCQFRRVAKRPCYSWRCGDCVSSGLEGKMIIQRIQPKSYSGDIR